jgi:hypothetical protein
MNIPEAFPAFVAAYQATQEWDETLFVPSEIALYLATGGCAAADAIASGRETPEAAVDSVERILRGTLHDSSGDHRWSHRWRWKAFAERVYDLVWA